jgi:4-alpha-glucanotransferase
MRRERVGRAAGLLVPLFSIPSRESWGVGEIPDVNVQARWMRAGGYSLLQMLPLNEMAEGQNSPYSALSAMAIDPIFIAPRAMPDVAALGGEAMLTAAEREAIHAARRARRVEYAPIRAAKTRVFRTAFDRFVRDEWLRETRRAAAFRAFIDRERWWLSDYTLFRALHAAHGGAYWREWPAALRDRDPDALEQARRDLSGDIAFYGYLQWNAFDQWADVRRTSGLRLFGDFPFMVSGDSADVWARQDEFRLDASVGAPPDAFSETGQDWGFPAYRWDVIASRGDEWLAHRAHRSADLYDGFRVDHLVGFFRTYVREPSGDAAFVPADEPDQIAQGERLMRLFASFGAQVIAEDLGVIPEFVRETLARLGVPGYKVFRWERVWDQEAKPFKDPSDYDPASVATSGTHDTEPLAEWWDAAPREERAALCALACLRDGACKPDAPFSAPVRDAMLEALFTSSSDIVLLPIGDLFGWRERINTPALVDDRNWRWRLPWPVEDLMEEPEALERAAFSHALAERSGRTRD